MIKENSKYYDVIVVGAGLSGLSCAFQLAAKKKRVLLVEAHSYAGGRTSSFNDKGMEVESGMHRYIGYYSALPSLLKKCGVSLNEIVTWEEKVDILVKGEEHKVVLGVAPVFGPGKTLRGVFGNRESLSWKDKLSLVSFFLYGFCSYPFSCKLDRFSVTEYANRHHVTERAKRLILEPLSTGIFFLPPENYSAYAFFGLFAPAIPKFYKMRIGAYLGGMTEVMCRPIAEKIEEKGGVCHFGEKVKTVMTVDNRVMGIACEGGQKYFARQTVIATTLPAAKKILEPLKETKDKELQKLFRLPVMSAASLQIELDSPALKKDITTFGPGTDMVSFAEQSRSTFRKSRGRLSVILGNPKENAGKTTEELVDKTIEEMESLGIHLNGHILDARKITEENDFYSLAKGNQRLRPRQKTETRGLVLAGDYTLTSSFATMEGAVIAGKKAAKVCLK